MRQFRVVKTCGWQPGPDSEKPGKFFKPGDKFSESEVPAESLAVWIDAESVVELPAPPPAPPPPEAL